MSLLLRRPFYAAEGGAGTSDAPPPSATPDITSDEPGYGGDKGLAGVDEILTADKFTSKPATTPEDVASIGAPTDASSPEAGDTTVHAPPATDAVASFFEEWSTAAGGQAPENLPDLPEGVDPKSATAEIFRQNAREMGQLKQQNGEWQQKFQQMGYAYDQTVQQMKQQMALLQQQIQQGAQPAQQQGMPPLHPNASPEEVDAYQRLAERFKQEISKTYDPKVQQLEQQLAQTQQFLQNQHKQQQLAQQRAAFARDAANVLEHVVFQPAGITKENNPELFNHMLEMTYAVAHKTRQPLAVAAKQAADQAMAFAKAFYESRRGRTSKAHQAIQSEPKVQPSGGLPLRGSGYPSADVLRANGFNSSYEWELRGKPQLSRKPADIPEYQLGDVT